MVWCVPLLCLFIFAIVLLCFVPMVLCICFFVARCLFLFFSLGFCCVLNRLLLVMCFVFGGMSLCVVKRPCLVSRTNGNNRFVSSSKDERKAGGNK